MVVAVNMQVVVCRVAVDAMLVAVAVVAVVVAGRDVDGVGRKHVGRRSC